MPALTPAAIDTYDDHRMAMCFSLAALPRPLRINDPKCVAKTFPITQSTLTRDHSVLHTLMALQFLVRHASAPKARPWALAIRSAPRPSDGPTATAGSGEQRARNQGRANVYPSEQVPPSHLRGGVLQSATRESQTVQVLPAVQPSLLSYSGLSRCWPVGDGWIFSLGIFS